ncbi:Similar to S.cerevisiae protein COQ4 (Protein with a role in ubiquinone (Coenzyme Q) biosynthesis) [Malassezia sympodialis ATCC 42132]|uniref:4-hydroxy-3-methoxy-5-polyprenylbenzoate decarboxylase n=1 Tax=Malassezia sympodialis (strain ATCC 42132) TaxID=1230383 RepID=A0A1M8A1C2_MALS4|nr:Similar to S.cerevisiae protein COQ4 (Protein with a role in ubiquinone (Coenzyme Q) biosynthesis) [Malassezia sympodialis ATCC 42132]
MLLRGGVASVARARALHTTRAAYANKASQHAHAHEAHERPDYGLRPALWERALLGAGSALGLLLSPSRGDLLTVLTQVSSRPRIDHLVAQMRSTHEGRCLLIARPSLNSQTVDTAALAELPPGTFGRAWIDWLRANRVGPDGRCEARYMPTYETRYVIQRYRETHDFYHVLLGMPTSTLGETVVKYFEAAHMHLPVAVLSALGGSLRIANDDARARLARDARALDTPSLVALAAWAVRLGHGVRTPLLSVHWEQRWAQPIDELRAELGLSEPPPVHLDMTQRPRPAQRTTAQVAGRTFYGWPSRVWERHGAKDARHATRAPDA